jgi:hypothetical protein
MLFFKIFMIFMEQNFILSQNLKSIFFRKNLNSIFKTKIKN